MQEGKYSNYYFFFYKNFTIGVCSTSTSGCFAHFEWQFGTCVDQVPSTSTTTIRFGHTGQQDQQQQQLGTSNGCFLQGGAPHCRVVKLSSWFPSQNSSRSNKHPLSHSSKVSTPLHFGHNIFQNMAGFIFYSSWCVI